MMAPNAARNHRILIVEDDEDLRSSLADVLGGAGYEVAQAADGQQAIEQLAQESPPDAIVLDLMMPVMDGWEFRAWQRREPALVSTPVVVLSANGSPQAEAIDADLYLTKPVSRRALVEGVARVVAIGERRRQDDDAARADRLAAIRTMAAGIAHEINNPLAALLAAIQLARARLTLRDGKQELASLLDMAQQSADQIRRVVRDAMSLVRSEDAAELVDVRDVLEAALGMTGAVLRDRCVVESDHKPIPLVRGSRARLTQVFLNLLTNAVDSLPTDRAGTVRTRTYAGDDGGVVVEISDSGCGIPADHQGKVFEPFFTTKPPGEGTGLGLSICHQIVRSMGGRIAVDSEIERGTTFRVALPSAML